MKRKIQSALITVFDKNGLEPVLQVLSEQGVKIYSTGGTQKFIERKGYACTSVESVTSYPSILGGRVKTLHPLIFGGILARRDNDDDSKEVAEFKIPMIDLIIVDLYPFEKTVASTTDEAEIIEKIDIGGPSLIRAAGKNFSDILVVADKKDYAKLVDVLKEGNGETTLEQRKEFAAKGFDVCTGYDIAISNYFGGTSYRNPFTTKHNHLRYGENPHQNAFFAGDLSELFDQLHGKELSYNNLVDIHAAIDLASEFKDDKDKVTFMVFKHTNVCGIARRNDVFTAFSDALAGDPESAFGGIWITNGAVTKEVAEKLNGIFYEVLIAPRFDDEALQVLESKKTRVLLKLKNYPEKKSQIKTLLNGVLVQDADQGNYKEWNEVGAQPSTENQKKDLTFGNILCKHLKSNAIAIVKNEQLIGKGCGQTSRVDALRQAIAKANQFEQNLHGAVVASDAFFPFDDCVKISHDAGITAFIQPGGSIRDKDSIKYCQDNGLAMVMTGIRHFRH